MPFVNNSPNILTYKYQVQKSFKIPISKEVIPTFWSDLTKYVQQRQKDVNYIILGIDANLNFNQIEGFSKTWNSNSI